MMTLTNYFFFLISNPLAILCSINCLSLFTSGLVYFVNHNNLLLMWSFFNLILMMLTWWYNYAKEFSFSGFNSSALEEGLRAGMIFFIMSEIFFFFSFFWTYFHFFLSPMFDLGLFFPGTGIVLFEPFAVPLINTLILVSSGVTVTIAHYALFLEKIKLFKIFMTFTIVLGAIFTFAQSLEYLSSFFSVSDSSFGASFFSLTGFHGIHVIVGTLFLKQIYLRVKFMTVNFTQVSGFDLASWYWHFVDVVWLFLYFSLYFLPSV